MNLNVNSLPTEILIVILSYTDPLTLENIPLVCKTWYNILKDDTIWNSIFKLQFPFNSQIFPSISRSNNYKTELIIRSHLIHNFKRGKLLNNHYKINHIITNSSISIDWFRNKLTIIDIPRDTIISFDLRNGKSQKFLNDFQPQGITSYDAGTSSNSILGSRCLIFGRWDGSVYGALIDYKGLILSDLHKWNEVSNNRITCVTSCLNISNSINNMTINNNTNSMKFNNYIDRIKINNNDTSHNQLIKSGSIGAFSCDESGMIFGWDIRNGDCLFKLKLFNENNKVIKLQSDGKTILICLLENGEIWVIKNIFKSLRDNSIKIEKFKIGIIPFDRYNSILLNLFVDYGNETVTIWNELNLIIYSFSIDNLLNLNLNNKLIYEPPIDTLISSVIFENNSKMFIKRDLNIVGSDPLLASIVLNNGIINIINIRETLSTHLLKPINLKPIMAKFLMENDHINYFNNFNTNLDLNISPIASVSINSVFIAIASHLGKVEIFDLMTGEYLRTVIDKIGKKKFQELENITPIRIFNNLIKLYIDENLTRGLLIIGNYLQYFLCGNSKDDNNFNKRNDKKFNNKKFIDKKGDSIHDIKDSIGNYQIEKDENDKEKQLLIKYNGNTDIIHNDEDELNLALVMSLSMNDNSNDIENSSEFSPINDDDHDMDEDLRLAIELSKAENYREIDEEQWEEFI